MFLVHSWLGWSIKRNHIVGDPLCLFCIQACIPALTCISLGKIEILDRHADLLCGISFDWDLRTLRCLGTSSFASCSHACFFQSQSTSSQTQSLSLSRYMYRRSFLPFFLNNLGLHRHQGESYRVWDRCKCSQLRVFAQEWKEVIDPKSKPDCL